MAINADTPAPNTRKSKKGCLIAVGIIAAILIIVLVATCIGSLTSSSSNREFTIKVIGYPQNSDFSGHILVFEKDGSSYSKSIDGTTPFEYAVEGHMVSCTFQKKTEYGYLGVLILKGEQTIAASDTEAAYGVVSLATK